MNSKWTSFLKNIPNPSSLIMLLSYESLFNSTKSLKKDNILSFVDFSTEQKGRKGKVSIEGK